MDHWWNQINKKYLERNEYKTTTIQNIENTRKAAVRGKFIAREAYLRKQDKPQINNFTLYLKQLDKEEQINLKGIRREKAITTRTEINEIETKRIIINKTKSWF